MKSISAFSQGIHVRMLNEEKNIFWSLSVGFSF
jgi:hypothetical protein